MLIEHAVPVCAVHDFHRDLRSFGLGPGIVEVNRILAELAVFIHGHGDGFRRSGFVAFQHFGPEGLAVPAHAVLIAADALAVLVIVVHGHRHIRIHSGVAELRHTLAQAAVAVHFHPHGGSAAHGVAFDPRRGNFAAFAGSDPFLTGIDFRAVLVIALHAHSGGLQILLKAERNAGLAQAAVAVHFHPHGGSAAHGVAFDPRRGNFAAFAGSDPFLTGIDFRAVLVIALHVHSGGLQHRLLRRQFARGKIQRIAAGQRTVEVHLNIGGSHRSVHRAGVRGHELVSVSGLIALPLHAGRNNLHSYAVLQRFRRQRCPVDGLIGIQRRRNRYALRGVSRKI